MEQMAATNTIRTFSNVIPQPQIFVVNQTDNANQRDESKRLHIALRNVNMSVVNAIRRTILEDIPIVGVKTTPYAENQANFLVNTSSLNNEILKQRLSCIPFIINPADESFTSLRLEIDVENNEEGMKYVTTDDFKLINIETGNELTESQMREILPHDDITDDPILFARLRPPMSQDNKGEHLKLNATFSRVTGRDSGTFNSVSCATYKMTENEAEQKRVWSQLRGKYNKDGLTEEEIESKYKNWKIHEAKRLTAPDSFEFFIEALNVYSNRETFKIACGILMSKFDSYKNAENNNYISFEKKQYNMPNCYEINIKNDDYTTGKMMEYIIYEKFFKEGVVSYVGFVKVHPHDTDSIIRLCFANKDDANDDMMRKIIFESCEEAYDVFNILNNSI